MDSSRHLFVDLKDDTRPLRPSYVFMMRCLLYSRIESGQETGADVPDEDVNVYLAHLLQSFADPAYVQGARPWLHRYDHEVFQRLERSTDARLKYAIYKTNADFLLVSIGVFDNPHQWLAHRMARTGSRSRPNEPSEEASMGRGKSYYHFAWTYSQQVNRSHPAVTDVLEKLSVGFDRYIKVLSQMRGEYLDLMKALSTGEIYHLERNVNKEEERRTLLESHDRFLDLWSEWKRAPNAENLDELRRAAAAIRVLDPEFHFTEELLPDHESADMKP